MVWQSWVQVITFYSNPSYLGHCDMRKPTWLACKYVHYCTTCTYVHCTYLCTLYGFIFKERNILGTLCFLKKCLKQRGNIQVNCVSILQNHSDNLAVERCLKVETIWFYTRIPAHCHSSLRLKSCSNIQPMTIMLIVANGQYKISKSCHGTRQAYILTDCSILFNLLASLGTESFTSSYSF